MAALLLMDMPAYVCKWRGGTPAPLIRIDKIHIAQGRLHSLYARRMAQADRASDPPLTSTIADMPDRIVIPAAHERLWNRLAGKTHSRTLA
ncbi:MAG: hypothetical protein ABF990_05505 [Acetobacter sp.]|uniref:hypothetical protein n=1 Tax=Acetobacter sp. TaxID=440 RepID=UPI0039E9C300